MQKLYATLDLSRSLSHFQGIVTELLDLSQLWEWDGQTVKDREAKIREAALVLAGECIALLLYQLSQSPVALQTAENQTQGWWQAKTQKHGYKKRQIITLGNIIVTLKLPYVVAPDSRSSGRGQGRGQGFCPFLRWLSLEEGLTPLVWSTLVEYGAMSQSFAVARSMLMAWGIRLSLKRIERLTYHFGHLGLRLRQLKLTQLKRGTLTPSNSLKDQRVVIAVDGGRTRLRRHKRGKRRSPTNRHGFWGEWAEPKLLTIYTVDDQGRKIKNQQIPIAADGTYEDCHSCLELLEMYLVELGISQAKQVLLVADGAEWIWKHIPPLLHRLGTPSSTYKLIDFYHVADHLQTFAHAAFSQASEAQAWWKQARTWLKKGQVSRLIQSMQSQRDGADSQQHELLDAQINYLKKNHKEGRLNYAKIKALHLPIGSGAVESLIRQVVNLRLKGNGKFWLKHHAEIMLHLRCQWCAGNGQTLCASLTTALLYPQATASRVDPLTPSAG